MSRQFIHVRYLVADQVLVLLLLLQGCHARACESQKRVVIRMSRREQDNRGRSIETGTMRGSKEMK